MSTNGRWAHGPVLIVGFGSAGRRHFRNLRLLGCEDFIFVRTGLSTVDASEIAGFAVTNSVKEALRLRPRIAVIANPTALHLQFATECAQADCHLYIEKPISHTLDGLAGLRAIVAERDLVAMVGCQYRFHPLLKELFEAVQLRRFGAICGCMAEWGEFLPDWHPWEDHRRSYSARRDLGGGVVLTLVHPLDYLYWIFGPALDITARCMRVPFLETPSGEDWADVTMRFKGGGLAHVHLDYIQRPPVHKVKIVGELGRAECDFVAGTLSFLVANGERRVSRVPENFERNSMFVDSMRHFLSCVSDRSVPPLIPLSDGEEVLRMVLTAHGRMSGEQP
jgi:predicted dehydrogenase